MPKVFRRLAAAVVALATAGCASLPPPQGRTESRALVDTDRTTIGRAALEAARVHPGKTGVYPLPNPLDAFATRAVLAAAAERSLDAQYYIWHGDQVGYLLFQALRDAADRGVRVRLLLDDNNTAGLDATIAALDAHPNVEVRLYNPFVQRGSRLLGFLTDFSRLNRRMHNKSFTVDNQATVVGGRNIGNEYFAAGEGVVFGDLDVFAIGAAVREVSAEFDLYWNSGSAYPARDFAGEAGAEQLAELRDRVDATFADPRARAYLEAVRTAPLLSDLVTARLPLEWVDAKVLFDDPAKTLDASASGDALLFNRMVRDVGVLRRSLDLVSPYFVPGDEGASALESLVRRGVRVRVLTNSLASNDVGAVHAGYARHRERLLRAGVKLYELKPSALAETAPPGSHPSQFSRAALHAKTYAVDDERIFVGSFNFDPRSAMLNTEMGMLIESPALATHLSRGFDAEVPLRAYEVVLAADGAGLEWIERGASGERRHAVEPGTTWQKRWLTDLMSILPIEWLL